MGDRASHDRVSAVSHLRVMTSIALLIVGVLYPEDKTSIAGVHWPPFVAFFGVVLIVAAKQRWVSGLVLSGWLLLWMAVIVVASLAIGAALMRETPALEFVLRHYLTLILTTVIAFLLVSDLPPRHILQGIYRFFFGLSVVLIAVRISILDFSREATFLGLGPLTFARYVAIGWIAQVALDQKLRLVPSVVFGCALVVADSKGPILFLLVTFVVWLLVAKRLNLVRAGFLLAGLGLALVLSGRFTAFTSDLSSAATGGLIVPDVAEFERLAEDESVSSTVARLIAVSASLEFIEERPVVGWGIGSWPSTTGLHYLEYPHNSVLEIWFEYGILGVMVFLVITGIAARAVVRGNPFSLFVIFCALLSLTTGSLRDLRVLFFFTLLAYQCMREHGSSRQWVGRRGSLNGWTQQ